MPSRRLTPRSPTRSLRTLLFSVLIALAFAQALGAMHRVLHAPKAVQAMLAARSASADFGASVFDVLFAGHDSEHACDHYDQLNHADLASGAHTVFAPAPMAGQPVALRPGWQLASPRAGFLARGPPARA